jgi:type I restriction enzyme M protein
VFWAAGISERGEALEQLSYLMLLRKLDAAIADGDAPAWIADAFEPVPSLRWLRLRALDPSARRRELVYHLIGFLTMTVRNPELRDVMDSARFTVPDAAVLDHCFAWIEEAAGTEPGARLGEQFDRLVDEAGAEASASAGGVRTPRHLADAVVRLLDPAPRETVCDLTVGSGGFLVAAGEHMRAGGRPPDGRQLVGFDRDRRMVRQALVNLMLHGVWEPELHPQDVAARPDAAQFEGADVVYSSPRFGVATGNSAPELGAAGQRVELLMLERARTSLRPGGRAVVVVPEGVLYGSGRAARAVREKLLTTRRVDAVVALPPGTFGAFSSIRTALLVFGTGWTDRVWFCEAGGTPDRRTAVGLSADETAAVADALLAQAHGKPRSQPETKTDVPLWSASADEIRERGWDLGPATYRPPSPLEHADEDPLELLAGIERIEEELGERLAEARRLLERR